MKLFGRKKSDENAVPADLQQYYNSGNSNVGTWVKRGALFVVVLVVLVGGGIWIFNKLSDKSGKPATQATGSSQQAAAEKKAAADKAKATEAAKQAAAEAKAKQAEADKKAAEAEAAQKKAAEANQQAAPTPENGVTGSVTPAPTTTNSQSSQLPNAGPGTALAAIFAGATALGTLVHAVFLRRRAVR